MLRRLTRFVHRLFVSPEPDEDGDDEDGTVWNLISDWQYDGLHTHSGGLERDEQEQALREREEEAAEVERGSESERR